MNVSLSESKQFCFLLILVAVVLLACTLLAGHVPGQVTLVWQASPSQGVVNYRLRFADATMTTNAPPLWFVDVGEQLTATLILTNTGRYFVDCRAMDSNGVQSVSSNELVFDVPEPPGQLRTLIVQHSLTVESGFTNAGFFRLEIK